MGSQQQTSEQSTSLSYSKMLKFVVLALITSLALSDPEPQGDSYGAPSAPAYSPPPQRQNYDSYSAPVQQVQIQQQLPQLDYFKHETHHYYHAGPPKVIHVRVPVTQKPYIVHVPQGVPVNFVPVQVPRQPAPQIQVIQQPAPYVQYGGSVHDPYVKRKELARSALLSGAGVVKGALITTLINAVNNNNNNGK